ncbi:putative universal stress protein [Roseovarius sp. A-2]|uniref:universal stress protein n=1 Tax=Roseovarius sp. A-2 TaxID=1570360 RepID=UPI0009B53305|nr:universal stress protein [Roseovarius sp. A-2]GAW35856.1 putative universal stress protein [Roseovarius sp. A-2]
MKEIMLATDFSERSDRALRRATLLARQFGAALTIIHVVDDDQPKRIVDSERDTATELLRELRSTVRTVDELACEIRVVLADPFEGIVRTVEEKGPDLLVIGAHRRRALRDVFVGTTAERTIRSVACPVLMVNAPPVGRYHHVMLTSDLSEGAKAAVNVCAALGFAQEGDASILYVYDAPAVRLAMGHTLPTDSRESYLETQRKEATRNLLDFVGASRWRSPKRILRQDLHGTAEEILRASNEEKADLIMVGTHGRSSLAKFFLGSVAEAVLRKAECDVLAIPPACAN